VLVRGEVAELRGEMGAMDTNRSTQRWLPLKGLASLRFYFLLAKAALKSALAKSGTPTADAVGRARLALKGLASLLA